MWCSTCRQDVPAIASPGEHGNIRCARCRSEMPTASSPATIAANANSIGKPAGEERNQSASSIRIDVPPLLLDEMELEEQLSHAQRRIASVRGKRADAAEACELLGNSPVPHAPWQLTGPAARESSGYAEPSKTRRKRGSFFSWTLLSLGMMSFVCGGVLLGWALIASRGDLWSLGIPMTLGGQLLLLIGLVMQLEGLWSNNRRTVDTLDALDDRLDELRHSTTLLTSSHSSAAQSFYTHFAEGADSKLLLADLKGQLDLLAVKMAKSGR